MGSIRWGNIKIKKGGDAGKVTEERKNSIISDSVSKWTSMGLTQKQVAFGIATMGIESGFNPDAKGLSKTERGLGQMNGDTWNRAVNNYNNNFGGNLDSDLSRKDSASQIAVMGAWIKKVWSMAEKVTVDPRLSGYSLTEIAYGMWHEGFGDKGNVEKVSDFLRRPDGFNNSNIRGYFNSTYNEANNSLYYYYDNACWSQPYNPSVIGTETSVPITPWHHLDPLTQRKLKDLSQGITIAGGETLRREGNQVWRVKTDGGTRGYFISE
ncbi:MAG: hypothetical protein HY893_09915 [Deltaproteobacteria bacterium]|nr:hypothetical protein [Deltaproteobacteria bacterium]